MQPDSPPLTASQKELLQQGIGLFNKERFFECHEVLEEVWLQASGGQKTCLHGLIQVAVALYHLRQKNLTGANRLLEAGMDKLCGFVPTHEMIDVEKLLKRLEPLRELTRRGQAPEDWQAPRIGE